MKLELKSVLMGVLLTVNVLLLLGLNSNDEDSQIGRYEVVMVPTGAYTGNLYTYDTTNGKYVKEVNWRTVKKEVRENPNRLR